MVRLLKPLSYYQEKYGSPLWGFTKLFLLMEKQHNRGQDGAGIATIKLDVPPGTTYLDRMRSVKTRATQDIFTHINHNFSEAQKNHPDEYIDAIKKLWSSECRAF